MKTIQLFKIGVISNIFALLFTTNAMYATQPTCSAGFSYESLEVWTSGEQSASNLVIDTGITIQPNYEVTIEDVWTSDDSSTSQPFEQFKAVVGNVDESGYTTDIDNNNPGDVYTDLGTLKNTSGVNATLTFRHYAADNDTTGSSDDGYNSVTLHGFCYQIIESNHAPVAVDDTESTPEDTTVNFNILTNDNDIDGDTLVVESITYVDPSGSTASIPVGVATNVSVLPSPHVSVAGVITVESDGNVTFVPTADYNGVVPQLTYVVNDTNGETATAKVNITIIPVDDFPTAVDDTVTIDEDTSINISVLNNDDFGGDGENNFVLLTQPTHGNITNISLSAPGLTAIVTYVPHSNYYGTDSFRYKITDTDGDEDTATVTINMTSVVDIIDAVDDVNISISGTGGTVVVDVTSNDTLDGNPVTLGTDVNITNVTQNTPMIIDPETGQAFIPGGLPIGVYTETYTLCEVTDPNNCDDAMVTVTLEAPQIDAVDDEYPAQTLTPNMFSTYSYIGNISTNDTFKNVDLITNLDDINLTLTGDTNLTTLAALDDSNGMLLIQTSTPAGSYYVEYQICEILNPTNCDEANATFTIQARTIDAVNDENTSVLSTGGAVIENVIDNDTLGGVAVTLGTDVNITNVTNNTLYLTIDPTTGMALMPGPLPSGTYTETYTICENINPSNCDDANVTVTVQPNTIDAVDDIKLSPLTLTPNLFSPYSYIVNVVHNDTLNGDAVNPDDLNITLTGNTNLSSTPALGDHSNDVMLSILTSTPAGEYYVEYRICEILNPTNCDEANATFTIQARTIDAVNDENTSVLSTGGAVIENVIDNDTLGGVAVTLGTDVNITNVTNNTLYLTIDPTTGMALMPGPLPSGTYTETYTICENINPSNCDDANVTVTVQPNTIDAVDDIKLSPLTLTPNLFSPYSYIVNVVHNDTLNGDAVNPDDLNITLTGNTNLSSTPALGDHSNDVMLSILTSTPAGEYYVEYRICEILNPTNCDEANATFIINANIIDAVDDVNISISGTGGTVVVDVTSNDTLDGNPVTLGTDVNITNVTQNTPMIIDPETGQAFIPTGLSIGVYTETYTLCEMTDPGNCDDAMVTVTLEAPQIDAVDDHYPEVNTIPHLFGDYTYVGLVTANDIFKNEFLLSDLDDINLTLTGDTNLTTEPALDNTNGMLTIQRTTPAGSYYVEYQICEILNPTNCDEANATFIIIPGVIDAIDDIGSIESTGGVVIPNIITNDTLYSNSVRLGTDVNITNVTNNTPMIIDVTTGSVIVPESTPAGTYTELYTLCENINPTNCDDANVTVTVQADPDFKPILTVYGGIVYGEGTHDFSFDTLVRNLNAESTYDENKPLIIRIPKNEAITLSYDSTMTLFKGDDVENNLWSFDDSDDFDYVMTYLGTEMSTNRTRFAITGTFSVEEGEVGKFILETTIKSGTGGDSNIDNNSDRDTMQKKL
ncbi:MAG: Internalin, putative [uncultured Sulfurovum sp.]|uniref:Internalin, putative n=1 Tax=uncultured Sulfurovum sp. TaxID=269237 RepID=A0A6S6U6W7_9BACT|nr:MAG: Internalin, putative [uncultured Sulfurovum sp.]